MSTVANAEPAIRVMALHALAYCERLFYLGEVEEIRVADAAVYAGRRLHEELAAEEGEIVSADLLPKARLYGEPFSKIIERSGVLVHRLLVLG